MSASSGKITRIDADCVTLVNRENKDGKTFRFAQDCKFVRINKKAGVAEKEEIDNGVNEEAFQTLEPGINAVLTINAAGEVEEVALPDESHLSHIITSWTTLGCALARSGPDADGDRAFAHQWLHERYGQAILSFLRESAARMRRNCINSSGRKYLQGNTRMPSRGRTVASASI
jgi:hypothetical protein